MPIGSHIRQCRHIKTNGVRCGSPALRGGELCYFHDRTERLFGAEGPGLLLPLSLEDEDAIQISLMKIIQEIFLGTIEVRRAALILRALQIAVANSRCITFDTPYTNNHAVHSVPSWRGSQPAPAEPSVAAPVKPSAVAPVKPSAAVPVKPSAGAPVKPGFGLAGGVQSPEGTSEPSPARSAGNGPTNSPVPQGTAESTPARPIPRETRNSKREPPADLLLRELQHLTRNLGSPEAAIKHKAAQIAGLGPPPTSNQADEGASTDWPSEPPPLPTC
jgi:hypothetical protein